MAVAAALGAACAAAAAVLLIPSVDSACRDDDPGCTGSSCSNGKLDARRW